MAQGRTDDARAPGPEDAARLRAARAIASPLARGEPCDDAAFDAFLPAEDRGVSAEYWTPLRVAVRVARWLDDCGVQVVVDVGSGLGKFCVAAALAGRGRFIGVEHRPRLVTAARALARTFDVEARVQFVEAAAAADWPAAQAYYLYNPFGENLCGRDDQLDGVVELSATRFERDVSAAEVFFAGAPEGTYVILYNGFGSRLPGDYAQVALATDQAYELAMWRKMGGRGS